jgi:hypothetical protein
LQFAGWQNFIRRVWERVLAVAVQIANESKVFLQTALDFSCQFSALESIQVADKRFDLLICQRDLRRVT